MYGGREAMDEMGKKETVVNDTSDAEATVVGILSMVKEGKIKESDTVIMFHDSGIPGIYTKHHRVEMEKELAEFIHII